MATIGLYTFYTDIEQSKKLAEILPLESADMYYTYGAVVPDVMIGSKQDYRCYTICWSLAALLKYLSEIKPKVYTPILFPSKAKWILQFAEHGHGNVCSVSCENPVDTCVTMIEKLNKLNLL